MKKIFWLTLILAAAFALVGCAGKPVGGMESAPAVRNMPAVVGGSSLQAKGAAAAPVSPSQGEFANSVPEVPERMIVRTAHITISVTDPNAAADAIAKLAVELGGFVASSNIYTTQHGEEKVTQGTVTIRVPADKYDTAIQRLRGTGTVLSYSSNTKDVSKEYVDLKARLHHLQVAAARLEQIMSQAQNTKDVLAVYRELSQVQGEIEQIQAQMKYLEHSVALATITVQLEQASTAKVSVGKWNLKGQAAGAVEFLIKTFKALVVLLVWLVIYVVPVLVVLYLLIGLPVKLVVRRIKRHLLAKKEQGAAETES